MSIRAAKLVKTGKKYTREQLLALVPRPVYDDGRTKQCHIDECNINKIMARFDATGTISHLAKYQPVYADFSDFDFHAQITKLAKGQTIFDALPAEIRKEFGQSPAEFFAYVNDPANLDDLREKLPGLAAPGQQLPRVASPSADKAAAEASAATPEKGPSPTPAQTPSEPPAATEEAAQT